MNAFCGLDFGTSNSTIGIVKDNACQLVSLENDKPAIRSALFCDMELKKWVFGQQGINHYLEGVPGRLMMSLKSVLGSSLMKEKTVVFNETVSYTDILGHFLKNLKTKAENKLEHELTQVVLGRPVHFHDHDDSKDKLAQNTLEEIAREVGFTDISFQFEPIAAALSYETQIQKEQLALIIDMGGGTSDFTVIRLHPNAEKCDRTDDVLANCGVHIAGTDFDKKLSMHSIMPLLGLGSLMKGSSSDIDFPSSYYHALTTWHLLTGLYDPKTISHIRELRSVAYEKELIERLIDVLQKRAGHKILNTVEITKQKLSDLLESHIDLSFIENNLSVLISQNTFNESISTELEKIINTIKETVSKAGVNFNDIDAIFYTGGSTKIPLIRNTINQLFPQAEIVQGDAFGSVGLGLTIDARRRHR
ncbi:MAG: Hsp70 family protein [Gammaproteobacteria bacterium]|nr:Hsp70 family protein [Gammaproteobacteria bacterium]